MATAPSPAGIDAHLAGEGAVAILVEDDVVGALLQPHVAIPPTAEVAHPADVFAVEVDLGVAGREVEAQGAHLLLSARAAAGARSRSVAAVTVISRVVAGVVGTVCRVVAVPVGIAVPARIPGVVPGKAQAQPEAEAKRGEEAAAEEATADEPSADEVAAAEAAGRSEEVARPDRVGGRSMATTAEVAAAGMSAAA